MTQITTIFSQVITWAGSLVTALFGENGALADLLPYFLLGIGLSIFLFIVKAISSLIWGR